MIDFNIIMDEVKSFYEFAPESAQQRLHLQSLEEKMKQWLNYDGFHLVSSKPNIGQVIVVVGETVGVETRYTLYRFIEIGSKWDVGADYQQIEAEEMMHELMSNVKL